MLFSVLAAAHYNILPAGERATGPCLAWPGGQCCWQAPAQPAGKARIGSFARLGLLRFEALPRWTGTAAWWPLQYSLLARPHRRTAWRAMWREERGRPSACNSNYNISTLVVDSTVDLRHLATEQWAVHRVTEPVNHIKRSANARYASLTSTVTVLPWN